LLWAIAPFKTGQQATTQTKKSVKEAREESGNLRKNEKG
jgi:hypothetical protein